MNYRVLYGFVGQHIVLISHGITKEKEVPDKEIDIAAARLALYEQEPERYRATEDTFRPEGKEE